MTDYYDTTLGEDSIVKSLGLVVVLHDAILDCCKHAIYMSYGPKTMPIWDADEYKVAFRNMNELRLISAI